MFTKSVICTSHIIQSETVLDFVMMPVPQNAEKCTAIQEHHLVIFKSNIEFFAFNGIKLFSEVQQMASGPRHYFFSTEDSAQS